MKKRVATLFLAVVLLVLSLTSCYKIITLDFETYSGSNLPSMELFVGEEVTYLPSPYKLNYKFIGWTLKEGSDELFEAPCTFNEDTTLYPIYEIDEEHISKQRVFTITEESFTSPSGHYSDQYNFVLFKNEEKFEITSFKVESTVPNEFMVGNIVKVHNEKGQQIEVTRVNDIFCLEKAYNGSVIIQFSVINPGNANIIINP